MTTMDLKGISWVGDMYNRFESMCVEVEEIIAQDAVKYVENQMLTVGASVKKLYTEVMEDLLLPPSLDPIKEGNRSMNAVLNVDASHSEKIKAETEGGFVNSIADRMVKASDSVASGDKNGNHRNSSAVRSVGKPCEPTLHNSVEQQCGNNNHGSQHAVKDLSKLQTYCAKDLDNRQDSEYKSPDMSTLNPYVAKDSGDELASCEVFSEIDEPLCKFRGVSSKLTSVLEVNQSKEDGTGISEEIVKGHGGVDIVEESKTTISSRGDVSANVNETLNPSIASKSESGDASTQGDLACKQLDRMKLGESCVLVDKSVHSFKVPLANEQKSYKKKIRDVFSRRRWSKGKRDHKQLAVWYEEQTGNKLVPTSLTNAGIPDLEQRDESLELDWELL